MDLLVWWTDILGLEGVEVVAVERGEGGKGWRLTVIPTSCVALCLHCNQPTSDRHMVRWQDIRDLPLAGQKLVLDAQAVQFTCKPCGKEFTVHPGCILEGMHVTVRLAEAVTDCVNRSTLSAASATHQLPESTVKAIFERVVERRRTEKARTLKPITCLGVDEIHVEVHDEPKHPPGTQPVGTEPASSSEEEKKIGRE